VLSREAAHYAARRAFGNTALVNENPRPCGMDLGRRFMQDLSLCHCAPWARARALTLPLWSRPGHGREHCNLQYLPRRPLRPLPFQDPPCDLVFEKIPTGVNRSISALMRTLSSTFSTQRNWPHGDPVGRARRDRRCFGRQVPGSAVSGSFFSVFGGCHSAGAFRPQERPVGAGRLYYYHRLGQRVRWRLPASWQNHSPYGHPHRVASAAWLFKRFFRYHDWWAPRHSRLRIAPIQLAFSLGRMPAQPVSRATAIPARYDRLQSGAGYPAADPGRDCGPHRCVANGRETRSALVRRMARQPGLHWLASTWPTSVVRRGSAEDCHPRALVSAAALLQLPHRGASCGRSRICAGLWWNG